ncbi:hypothetical protein TNCT_585241, partial [Trichonephila clavata]
SNWSHLPTDRCVLDSGAGVTDPRLTHIFFDVTDDVTLCKGQGKRDSGCP